MLPLTEDSKTLCCCQTIACTSKLLLDCPTKSMAVRGLREGARVNRLKFSAVTLTWKQVCIVKARMIDVARAFKFT